MWELVIPILISKLGKWHTQKYRHPFSYQVVVKVYCASPCSDQQLLKVDYFNATKLFLTWLHWMVIPTLRKEIPKEAHELEAETTDHNLLHSAFVSIFPFKQSFTSSWMRLTVIWLLQTILFTASAIVSTGSSADSLWPLAGDCRDKQARSKKKKSRKDKVWSAFAKIFIYRKQSTRWTLKLVMHDS